MLQKLFSLVDQTSVPDNPDALQNQEVLLPGHLITIYLKVKSLVFHTHEYALFWIHSISMWFGICMFAIFYGQIQFLCK